MERLTKRIGKYVYYTQGKYEDTIPAEMEPNDIRNVLKKLAEYEDAEEQKLQCKPGDRVWCIEGCDGELELAGYLFMATCGEFVIATSEYVFKSFGAQLVEMSEESLEFDGVSVMIFEKEAVFLTKEEAEQALARMEGGNEM